MKTTTLKAVGLALFAFCATTAAADVFSDCHFWLRGGMAVDRNGNGVLDNGEMTDSLGRMAIESEVFDGRQALAFREETVRMPMRGQVAALPVLYFPQEPVVTNAETGAGWAQSQSVKLKNIFNDYTDKYSFIIRFRPDAGLPLNRDWSWILNMGYGGSGGFMLGLNGNAQNRQLRLFSSKTSFEVTTVTNACWTDFGVSIDGTNFTCVTSIVPDGNNTDANIGYLTTRVRTFSNSNGGVSVKPAGSSLVIGTESPSTDRFAITNTPAVQWTNGNAGKAFRGSIQQLAFWKRALSADELREALAWPNADVLKIGVEDNATAEFSGTESSGSATMDDTRWNLPGALAAGGEMTFTFPLVNKQNHDLPQVLRLLPTSDSSAALVRVAVNGRVVRTSTLTPGHRRSVFIDASYFQAGDNELVLTRVDAGTQPLRLDALALGGSWAVGLLDYNYHEFAHENSPGSDYWVADHNWKSVKRAFLGSGSSHSNQVWRFSLPDGVAGHYNGRLSVRIRSNANDATTLTLAYDDRVFATKMHPVNDDTFVRELSADELGPGEHTIFLANGTGNTGNYWSVDYARFELFDIPSGTMMLIR